MTEEKQLKEAQSAYAASLTNCAASLTNCAASLTNCAASLTNCAASLTNYAAPLTAAPTGSVEPVILKQDGQPIFAVLPFEEYRRLQKLAERKRVEAEAKWRERFDHLLAEVHSQTARYSSDEIEAEITAAFDEVRKIRYGNSSAD